MKILDSLPIKGTIVHQPQQDNTDLLTEMMNKQSNQIETKEEESIASSKELIEEAIKPLNDFFEIENRSIKFVLHDGLDEYYVQVVNTESKQVIREIPNKKILDAFYSMQKFLGMIVDEKI